jgi:hypothetical protein
MFKAVATTPHKKTERELCADELEEMVLKPFTHEQLVDLIRNWRGLKGALEK